MAEIASGLLGPAIEVVKWVGAPIKRQFNYLCCFTSNIVTLKDEAEKLDDNTSALQQRVITAENNAQEIFLKVENWLTDSGNIMRSKDRILSKATEAKTGCLNFAKRVSLSKEAKKTTEAMTKHIKECEFDSVAPSRPIAAHEPVRFGKDIHTFNSRKRFKEDIMKTLTGRNVDKVGICGTGGVGKTIMAQEILNKALNDGLFHEIVSVTVGQPVEELVIQKKIAELLGLTLKEETLEPRAEQLLTRLRQKQRTLILLDDVWIELNLEKLGIPCDREWCTIILTSRNKDVLKRMKVKNVCELGVLREYEAWNFFKKMAGACVDDAILKPTAYDVMKECKGLLVALESVGKAHEDEDRLDFWKDSLEQLRKHNPIDIPNVIKEVYRPLKLSYERLESENAKSTILLCSLFAEDADIPLQHLTYFAMGLSLFDGIWELEQVRGRIRRSIDTLRNRCLLLDSSKEDHVRMHDVVRDVSIFIASEEMRVRCRDCTWISSHVRGGARHDSPLQPCFPELKLLWMNMNNKVEQEMGINIGNLIRGSTKLNVLFIEEYSSMKSLPALKMSLTTLVLHHCASLESIAVVAELESLEIDILLETIHIENCIEMEHLVLVRNEEEQDKEADITLLFPKLKILYLDGLPKLRSMISSSRGIESIQFPLLAEMEIRDCDNLKCLVSRDDEDEDHHYQDGDDSLHLFCHPKVSYDKLKRLRLGRMESKNVWCDKVPDVFFNGLVELNISEYKKIRSLFSSKIPQYLVNVQTLKIKKCEEMVKVIEDEDVTCDHTTTRSLFPSLQEIQLFGLPKLESFCEWKYSLPLLSLKTLWINDCPEMKSFDGPGSLIITRVLQTVRINGKDLKSADDLNPELRRQYMRKQRGTKNKKKVVQRGQGEIEKAQNP